MFGIKQTWNDPCFLPVLPQWMSYFKAYVNWRGLLVYPGEFLQGAGCTEPGTGAHQDSWAEQTRPWVPAPCACFPHLTVMWRRCWPTKAQAPRRQKLLSSHLSPCLAECLAHARCPVSDCYYQKDESRLGQEEPSALSRLVGGRPCKEQQEPTPGDELLVRV